MPQFPFARGKLFIQTLDIIDIILLYMNCHEWVSHAYFNINIKEDFFSEWLRHAWVPARRWYNCKNKEKKN